MVHEFKRRTSRPLVIWLDDKVADYSDFIASFAFHGIDVIPTHSITQFLSLLQTDKPQLIIVDIHLADLENGRAIVDLIYKVYPQMNIIVYSGYITEINRQSYDANRVAFVAKNPLDIPQNAEDDNELLRIVRALLTREKPRPNLIPNSVSIPGTWSTLNWLGRLIARRIILPLSAVYIAIRWSSMFGTVTPIRLLFEVGRSYLWFLVPAILGLAILWFRSPKEIWDYQTRNNFIQQNLPRAEHDDNYKNHLREIAHAGNQYPNDPFTILDRAYTSLDISRYYSRLGCQFFIVAAAAYLVITVLLDLYRVVAALVSAS